MITTIKIKRGLESDRAGIVPQSGELIYTTDENKLYVGDGVTAGGVLASGSGSSVTTSETAPTGNEIGDVWFDSVNGIMYVYYSDGTDGAWIDVSGNSFGSTLPDQTGNGGKYLTTDGTAASWGDVTSISINDTTQTQDSTVWSSQQTYRRTYFIGA